jgi:hypothetical protein
MQLIKARVARADFAKTLGKMREWLDRNDCQLAGFETAVDGMGMVTVKALFDSNELAETFRLAFKGFESPAVRPGPLVKEGHADRASSNNTPAAAASSIALPQLQT